MKLPASATYRSPRISKRTLRFAWIAWFFHIGWVLLSIFIRSEAIFLPFLVFFIILLSEAALSGALHRDLPETEPSPHRDRIDACLNTVMVASLLLAAFCFGMLLLNKGGPEQIDGIYYVVNHGDIIREISRNYYLFLSFCESLLASAGTLGMHTPLLHRIRNLYRLQNEMAR